MIREVSSASTIGRDEARKPLMKAYMFQRRVLFCCSCLMVVSLLTWIIAIATDHWIIITGTGGIFIPETRRFFMSSHSGLWRFCRNTVTPNAEPTANVVRNFTSFAIQNQRILEETKLNCSQFDFIKEFSGENPDNTSTVFTESHSRKMFWYWVTNETAEFDKLKSTFEDLTPMVKRKASAAKPIIIDPTNVADIRRNRTFGNALQELKVNSTTYYFVIPETVQVAIFKEWNETRYNNARIIRLLWPYARDLGLPGYVLNADNVILQLVPPKPPKRGRKAFGYDYIPNSRCKYIEMFQTDKSDMDLGFDATLMDYIRSQASFACITVFVMLLGSVFSFYTFVNPRYMFKRLAGGINLVSASTSLVVLQVLFASVDYTRSHLFYSYPDGAELTYGYGVFFSWFTFTVNLTCGVLFIWYSGKKKGARAPTDEIAMADEAINIGR